MVTVGPLRLCLVSPSIRAQPLSEMLEIPLLATGPAVPTNKGHFLPTHKVSASEDHRSSHRSLRNQHAAGCIRINTHTQNHMPISLDAISQLHQSDLRPSQAGSSSPSPSTREVPQVYMLAHGFDAWVGVHTMLSSLHCQANQNNKFYH